MTRQADRADSDLLVDPSVTEGRIRTTLLGGAVVVAVALVATFVSGQWRTEAQLREQLLLQARAFTEEIVATRQFVSNHGGIYVEESEEATLNPYLLGIPGLRVRVTDRDGTTYVLQNPSLVVRNVNEQLAGRSRASVRFHMASDKPLAPYNMADEFELEALEAFAQGAGEYAGTSRAGGRSLYRYVYPLEVTAECVKCHGHQGWRPGEVRGGISVSIDAESVDRAVSQGRTFTALTLAGSLASLLFVLYLVSTGLLGSLLAAETRLRELATQDPLTGLANRRAAMQRLATEVERAHREDSGLTVIMLDLDHFKRVNDAAGHSAGDAVLAAAAAGMASRARVYDTVARIGGEEFLVIMPGADEAEGLAAAERIREAVARRTAGVEAAACCVTVSAGVAARAPGKAESPGDLLRRADRALYRAKDAGRDRAERG